MRLGGKCGIIGAVKVGVELRVCVANEQGVWCGKCRRDERGRMVDEDEEV